MARALVVAALFTVMACVLFAAPPAAARWEEEIRAFEAQDLKSPPAPDGVLFGVRAFGFGSSMRRSRSWGRSTAGSADRKWRIRLRMRSELFCRIGRG